MANCYFKYVGAFLTEPFLSPNNTFLSCGLDCNSFEINISYIFEIYYAKSFCTVNCNLNKTYKTLKMQKDVGMAYQRVCKQGRDDNITIVKVNLQSLIPASFSH